MSDTKSPDITWHRSRVTREDRETLGRERGAVLWFTGLSGSGKSTIANELDHQLHRLGHRAYLLDGDNLRFGLNSDLGFSPEDREENIRRVSELARLYVDAGLLVIVAAISPYRKDRQLARDKVPADRFIEIHVDTPIELCEQRDPKGLYQKARAGEIRGFTGIDAPYESPTSPELRLTPDAGDPPALANQVIEALQNRALIVEHCPKDLS